ncbi:hypothetical protein TNCV_2009171 [Trichonephila clavipes]|nr:hypothetical protein TNCV_2009171 [Trichonephila clavipes]
MKLSLLMSHASVCNTTMVEFEFGEHRGEDAEPLRYAPTSSQHRVFLVISGCFTDSSCHTRSTLATCGCCKEFCTPSHDKNESSFCVDQQRKSP